MKQILLFVIILIVEANCLLNFNSTISFISNVLVQKNIKFAAFYTCFRGQDSITIHKALSELDVRSIFINPQTARGRDYESFTQQLNLGIILDLSCEGYDTVLNLSENYNLFQSHYKWILIDTQKRRLVNIKSIQYIFAKVTLRMDSDVLAAIFDNSNTNITLYDVYHSNCHQSEVTVTPLGFWVLPTYDSFNGIVLTYRLSKYEQRKNMTGLLLKTAIVNAHSSSITSIDAYYRDLSYKNYDTINKLSYALFQHLHDIHNFTYLPKHSPECYSREPGLHRICLQCVSPTIRHSQINIGKLLGDQLLLCIELILTNKWFGDIVGGMDDGLAKLLYEKTVDFGASPGLLRVDRIHLYDFFAPVYPFRTCFIFRNPGASSKIQNEFLKPFDYSIWWYIIGYVVLFCVFLKTAFFIEERLFTSNEENSWTTAYLLTWAVFCQQGATFIPKPISGRCTILTMLLMSLLLYNYYTSSIVSSLLSGLPPPFETIEELTESNLDVGIEDIVYMRTLFQVTNDSRIKRLYNHKVLAHKNPSYEKVEEGIKKVKSGGYAYHTEPTTGYPIIKTTFEPYEICDLAEINLFKPSVLWVYAQKQSQYSKLLAIGYYKMLEAGIISRERSVWITSKPDCLASTHLVQVGIHHLSPAFIMLVFGLIISLLLLILEKMWCRNRKILLFRLKKMLM